MDEEIRPKPVHILLVIGNPQIRRLFKTSLRNLGYHRVQAVENGLEALQWLNSGEKVDLVITGLRMARGDGFDLLERIRSNPETEDLPVILIAGKATEQLVAQAIETDADAYLLIPCSPAELDRRIQQLMERQRRPTLYHQLILSGKATLDTAPDEALMWFREAVNEDPDNPIGYYWLGRAYENRGAPRKAEQAYLKAVRLNPLHVKSMERLCRLYRSHRRTRELYLVLRRLVKVRPDRLDLQMELGPLALAMGDAETGTASFEAVVGGYRDDPEKLLEVLTRFERFDAVRADLCRLADRLFQRYAEHDPEKAVRAGAVMVKVGEGAKIRDGLVRLLRRSKDLDNALKVEIHLLLAAIYEQAGIERLAKEHRETAAILKG